MSEMKESLLKNLPEKGVQRGKIPKEERKTKKQFKLSQRI